MGCTAGSPCTGTRFHCTFLQSSPSHLGHPCSQLQNHTPNSLGCMCSLCYSGIHPSIDILQALCQQVRQDVRNRIGQRKVSGPNVCAPATRPSCLQKHRRVCRQTAGCLQSMQTDCRQSAECADRLQTFELVAVAPTPYPHPHPYPHPYPHHCRLHFIILVL